MAPIHASPSGAACPGLFSNDVLARLSEVPSIVGIKSTIGAEATVAIRERCGKKVLVSDPLEENWLVNLIRHNQTSLYADPEPYLYQSTTSQPIQAYYDAWLAGAHDEAVRIDHQLRAIRRVYNRWIMSPLRNGLAPNAALKFWCECLGMAGGGVRTPLKSLSPTQEEALRLDLRSGICLV